MVNMRGRGSYGGLPWEELEVVVIEIRAATAAVLPILVQRDPTRAWAGPILTITEPLGGTE
jgi:hypothetical protein